MSMSLRQQFVAVLRELPDYILGAPDRWLMRVHQPQDFGDGYVLCMEHRTPEEWPCEAYLNAEWRSQH